MIYLWMYGLQMGFYLDLYGEKHVSMVRDGASMIVKDDGFTYKFPMELIDAIANDWCPGHAQLIESVSSCESEIVRLKDRINELQKIYQDKSSEKAIKIANNTLVLNNEKSKNNRIVDNYNSEKIHLKSEENNHSILAVEKNKCEVENSQTIIMFEQLKKLCEENKVENDILSDKIASANLELQNKQVEVVKQSEQIASNDERIAMLKKQLEEKRKHNKEQLHDLKSNAIKEIDDERRWAQKSKKIYQFTVRGVSNLQKNNDNTMSSTACSSEEITIDQEKK